MMGRPPPSAVVLELEHLRARPNVRRVVRDEDGHVADNAHAALVRVLFQLEPLLEEGVLKKPVRLDSFCEATARALDRGGFTLRQTRPPTVPPRALVLVPERGEERVVVEPDRRETVDASIVAAQALGRRKPPSALRKPLL